MYVCTVLGFVFSVLANILWLGRSFQKWPILCRVRHKLSLSQPVCHVVILYALCAGVHHFCCSGVADAISTSAQWLSIRNAFYDVIGKFSLVMSRRAILVHLTSTRYLVHQRCWTLIFIIVTNVLDSSRVKNIINGLAVVTTCIK